MKNKIGFFKMLYLKHLTRKQEKIAREIAKYAKLERGFVFRSIVFSHPTYKLMRSMATSGIIHFKSIYGEVPRSIIMKDKRRGLLAKKMVAKRLSNIIVSEMNKKYKDRLTKEGKRYIAELSYNLLSEYV